MGYSGRRRYTFNNRNSVLCDNNTYYKRPEQLITMSIGPNLEIKFSL